MPAENLIKMYIAQEKYRTNISEYILYMFHIEDVIRAHNFDIQLLENKIISTYHLPDEEHKKVTEWYLKLMDQLDKNDARVSGHTLPLSELLHQLNDLHILLLNTLEEEQYVEYYRWAKPIIDELKNKMHNPAVTEIEVCFNGLYGYMLLKLKQQEITKETADAFTVLTQMLRYLAKKFNEKK